MTTIKLSRRSVKDLKSLKKKFIKIEKDLDDLFFMLSRNSGVGDRIQNFGSLEIYKARVRNSSSGVGKSGGFRVIYYAKRRDNQIVILTLYSKSEKQNISKNEILEILRMENLFS